MVNKLIVIRGLPGSGKTTKAKQIKVNTMLIHIEADMYYNTTDYKYEEVVKTHVTDAHAWCQSSVNYNMHHRVPTIIVANTFTQFWELEPYIKMAKKHNYEVEIINCTEQYSNIHGVPEHVLEAMKQRYVKEFDTTAIQSLYGITCSNGVIDV